MARSRIPSPAMLVSVIALSLALGGSAIAADGLTKKQVKKIAKKQAKKQIKKKAPGLSVAEAGTAGVADSPSVFARVEEDATIVPGLARGLVSSNVTRPSTGVYCFNLPFNPKGGQVTVEGNSDPDEVAQLIDEQSPDGLLNCPAGTEIEVQHYDTSTPGFENGDFYIELYR